MNTSTTEPVVSPSKWQRAAPIITLIFLSPVIADVLFGSIRITTLFVLILVTGFWGCAALIIRDVVRRHHQGWLAILLLGIALAIAEECVIQQTSLAPLIGVDPNRAYGRALGVNWIYLIWALGYESIWAVVLPIQLTELIFPDRRDIPWLGKRGLIISTIILALASFFAWYSWTQILVPQYFPNLDYQVPLSSVLIALAIIVVLVAIALRLPSSSIPEQRRTRLKAPSPWQVGLIAFTLGLPWFGLVLLSYGAVTTLPPVIPAVVGVILAGSSFFLIEAWASSPNWQDAHRLGLILGALLASMLGGSIILTVGGALPIDRIGQLVLNLIAIVLLIYLVRRVQLRKNRRHYMTEKEADSSS